jgi:hypothetical protein
MYNCPFQGIGSQVVYGCQVPKNEWSCSIPNVEWTIHHFIVSREVRAIHGRILP